MMASLLSCQDCSPAEVLHLPQGEPSFSALRAKQKHLLNVGILHLGMLDGQFIDATYQVKLNELLVFVFAVLFGTSVTVFGS